MFSISGPALLNSEGGSGEGHTTAIFHCAPEEGNDLQTGMAFVRFGIAGFTSRWIGFVNTDRLVSADSVSTSDLAIMRKSRETISGENSLSEVVIPGIVSNLSSMSTLAGLL